MHSNKDPSGSRMSARKWLALRRSFRPLIDLRDLFRQQPTLLSAADRRLIAWGNCALALDAEEVALRTSRHSESLTLRYRQFVAACLAREHQLPLNLGSFEPDMRELVLACDAEPVLWHDSLERLIRERDPPNRDALLSALAVALDDYRKKRAYVALVRQHRDLLHSSSKELRAFLISLQEEHQLSSESLDPSS